MAPHIANFLLGSFGIVAAVLLIGGSVVLRAQQNRQRFELAKKALDAGHPLPTPEPVWIGLKRQAQSILAVGFGLIVVGIAAWWLGSGATMPTLADNAPATQPIDLPALIAGRPPKPPRPSPEMELWHNAQERVAVGQTAIGCGVILVLLGLTRLNAAKSESRYAAPQNSETVV